MTFTARLFCSNECKNGLRKPFSIWFIDCESGLKFATNCSVLSFVLVIWLLSMKARDWAELQTILEKS